MYIMYAPDLSYQILRLGLFVYSSKNDTEKVAPHILSIHTPPHPPGFRPLPLWPQTNGLLSISRFELAQTDHGP